MFSEDFMLYYYTMSGKFFWYSIKNSVGFDLYYKRSTGIPILEYTDYSKKK